MSNSLSSLDVIIWVGYCFPPFFDMFFRVFFFGFQGSGSDQGSGGSLPNQETQINQTKYEKNLKTKLSPGLSREVL